MVCNWRERLGADWASGLHANDLPYGRCATDLPYGRCFNDLPFGRCATECLMVDVPPSALGLKKNNLRFL